MKKLSALLLVFSICFSFFGVICVCATWESPLSSFVSFRMYSEHKLSDDSIKIQITVSDRENLRLTTYVFVAKNNNHEFILGEYIPAVDNYRIGFMSYPLVRYNLLWQSNSWANSCTYMTSGRMEYQMPIEFFKGDSGTVEIIMRNADFFPATALRKIYYEKDAENIYFSLENQYGEGE